MWTFFSLTLLTWMTVCTNTSAQEYLPPKIGGGGKKPAPEPTLPANYDFSYDVQDNAVSLDFGHNEKRKDDRATGSYHVLLPDGRTQLVEYEAGPDGYKPQVEGGPNGYKPQPSTTWFRINAIETANPHNPKIMYMGTATYPAANAGDKFDGYHYNAASNRQSVRQAAPRSRQQATAPPPAPAPPVAYASSNATQ